MTKTAKLLITKADGKKFTAKLKAGTEEQHIETAKNFVAANPGTTATVKY